MSSKDMNANASPIANHDSARPLVSIAIATYNRPEALSRVVRGMLAQTYSPIEIVVTDDGDSEATRAALGPLLAHIRYEANEKRLGIYGNWNRAIELSRGELVASYHDHDEYAPNIVERSVELFRRHARVGIVHVGTAMVWEDGRRAEFLHRDLPEIADGLWFAHKQAWCWPSYVAHGSIMVRRELYERLGKFDESMGFAADMEMLNRFCRHCDIGYVPELLYETAGRTPKDTFYEFKWQHLVDYIRVRELAILRLYEHDRTKLVLARAALRAQIDERILKQLASTKVRNQDALVREGLEVARAEATKLGQFVAALVASDIWAARAARRAAYAGYRMARDGGGPFRFRQTPG